jgi:cytochrome c5
MKQGPLMLMVGGIILTASIVAAQTTTPHSSRETSYTPSTAGHELTAPSGQKVFEQNCSRCHNAPEGFSPNISGTIAAHMRVRAGLSEADYKALLRYLNP